MNKKLEYPIIKVPEYLNLKNNTHLHESIKREIIEKKFGPPVREPFVPKMPEKPLNKANKNDLFWFILPFSLVAFSLVSLVNGFFGGFFFLLVLAFFGYKIASVNLEDYFLEEKHYNRLLEYYRVSIKFYEENEANYPSQRRKYEEYLKLKETVIDKYIRSIGYRNKLKKELKELLEDQLSKKHEDFHEIHSCTTEIKKGASEDDFVKKLIQHFGEQSIMVNKSIDGKYYPDITLLYKDKILVDIEIDEPYTFEEGDYHPIHYCSISNDTKSMVHVEEERDNYFIKNHWIVARFAEVQVVKNPAECIQILKQLVEQTSNGISEIMLSPALKNIAIPVWTYDEAIDMINMRFRKSYIK